jgi:hypothetical protein
LHDFLWFLFFLFCPVSPGFGSCGCFDTGGDVPQSARLRRLSRILAKKQAAYFLL